MSTESGAESRTTATSATGLENDLSQVYRHTSKGDEVTFEWKRFTDLIFGIIAGFGLGLCAVDQGWITLTGH